MCGAGRCQTLFVPAGTGSTRLSPLETWIFPAGGRVVLARTAFRSRRRHGGRLREVTARPARWRARDRPGAARALRRCSGRSPNPRPVGGTRVGWRGWSCDHVSVFGGPPAVLSRVTTTTLRARFPTTEDAGQGRARLLLPCISLGLPTRTGSTGSTRAVHVTLGLLMLVPDPVPAVHSKGCGRLLAESSFDMAAAALGPPTSWERDLVPLCSCSSAAAVFEGVRQPVYRS